MVVCVEDEGGRRGRRRHVVGSFGGIVVEWRVWCGVVMFCFGMVSHAVFGMAARSC